MANLRSFLDQYVWIGLFISLTIAILLADLVPPLRRATFPPSAAVTYLVSVAAFVLVRRWPFLRYDPALNPDEALMAANAMSTRYGWLNWDIVDPTTSGPLNSIILAWPYLFGAEITMFSTRLTGVACVLGVVVLLFLTIRRLADTRVAIMATFPCALFLGLTRNFDFVHYSSEQLPILLLSGALYCLVCSFDRPGMTRLLAGAFVIGCVPFAKLQAGPIAAVIGVVLLARAWSTGASTSSAVKRAAAVALAASVPAFIFLGPLALSGGLDDFFKSYILQQRLRAASWSNPASALLTRAPGFRALLETYGLIIAGGAVIVAVRAILMRSAPAGGRPAIAWMSWLSLALLIVSAASILAPGRVFAHYLLLAVPAFALAGGVAIALTQRHDDAHWRRALGGAFVVLLSAAIIVGPTARSEQKFVEVVRRNDDAFLRGAMFSAPHLLAWLRPRESDRILCWGWNPICYVDSAVRPATRDATNETQLYETALRDYFRSRFIRDFDASDPDFVIDDVAPENFGFADPLRHGIPAFPELAARIARDFELVSRVEPPARCPRLYVRRARLAQLNKSRIAFQTITASAAAPGHDVRALDDGSVQESCDDNWLLPAGMLGSATIQFSEENPVGTVALLNTRRGESGGVAGSGWVRLSLLHGDEVVARQDLALRPYPYWTFYRPEHAGNVDRLTIEILSIFGSGGLNEVKVYRD